MPVADSILSLALTYFKALLLAIAQLAATLQ
jgi:hypothetical protein